MVIPRKYNAHFCPDANGLFLSSVSIPELKNKEIKQNRNKNNTKGFKAIPTAKTIDITIYDTKIYNVSSLTCNKFFVVI